MLATQDPAMAIAHTTQEAIDLWLYGKSKNTRSTYHREINQFLAFTGKEVGQWTVNDIQSYGLYLDGQRLKRATVNKKILAIKSLLSYCHKLGLIPVNPGGAVPVKPLKNSLAERILTEYEVMEMIYSTSHAIERSLLKLLYATGCRVSEALNLKWSDSRDRGEAVQLTIFGKGDKTRHVLIKKELWNEVKLSTNRRGEYIFSTRTGKPYDRARVHRIIKKAGKRVGLPGVSAHWFRHSHASHSLDRGCPISTLQSSLGHRSIETTQRYLHSRPEDGSSLHLVL